MINSAAKFELGLFLVALALAVGVGAAISDPGSFVLVLGVCGCILLSSVALAVSGFNDRAPRFPPGDVPPVQMISAGPGRVPRSSPWPMVGALALGLVAIGLAVGATFVAIGVVVGLLATAGWLAQAWREDPTYTASESAHISSRLLMPYGLPVMALTLIAVIVISVSRILLTLPRAGSIILAFALALGLLFAFFFLSARPNLRRNSLVALSGVAIVALVTAGSLSAAHGYRTFDNKPPAGPTVVVAQGLAFKQKTITVTQGQLARIEFKNLDRGTYHNVAVYSCTGVCAASGSNATTAIWAGEPIEGDKKILYSNTFNLPPGTYVFRCNFHPTSMVGVFVVKASSS